ncbi:hypothetical protein [Streptomyces sp. NPDC059479]|uniref:hypothetical protein n=1 Tax=Streptomyces sp. NPDC059479 TaxID=3346848 RepID=UPI0036C5483F
MTTPTDPSPLPSTIPTVRVHGWYRGLDGRSLNGTVTFSAPGLLTFPVSDLFIAGPVVATLDENGSFAVNLPATDAPDMNPSGWAYTVKENLAGVVGSRVFTLLLPKDGTDVDLADVAPADPTTPNYVPVPGPKGDRGPVGPAGSKVFTGSAVPDAALGVDGDIYNRYETGTYLGVTSTTVTSYTKNGGAWTQAGGPVRGAAWYVSTTTPSTDTRPGDMFLRADTGEVWQHGASGWGSPMGSLKGPKGDTGPASTVPGPKGDSGDPGPASTVPGPKGDKGDPGMGSVNSVNGSLGPDISITVNGRGAGSPDIALLASDVGAISSTDRGAPGGVASLDETGKVPSSQLSIPSGVVTAVNGKPGPTVTLVASDVSALAVSARGAANGVASLDSSSRLPLAQLPLEVPTDHVWEPSDLGLKAWAFDPAVGTSTPLYSGNATLRITAVNLKSTQTISKICWHFGGYAGGMLAGSWGAVYNASGTRMATTAVLTGETVIPGVHNAGGQTVSAPLTTSPSLVAGIYYVAWSFRYNTTTNDGPMMLCADSAFSAPPNVFGLNNVKRYGSIAGTAATTAPATLALASVENGSNRFWAALA